RTRTRTRNIRRGRVRVRVRVRWGGEQKPHGDVQGTAARRRIDRRQSPLLGGRLSDAPQIGGPGAPAAGRARERGPPARPAPPLVLPNLAAAQGHGLELLRALRAHPALGSLRILAYAGHLESAAIHAAQEAGADQVLANSAVAGHLETVLRKAGLIADT